MGKNRKIIDATGYTVPFEAENEKYFAAKQAASKKFEAEQAPVYEAMNRQNSEALASEQRSSGGWFSRWFG